MTALVFFPSAFAVSEGLIANVSSRTSTSTGVEMALMTTFAVAGNVKSGTTISLRILSWSASMARLRAVVQDEVATAYFAPI